jgi:biotin synthase-like enzyme
LVKAGKEVDVTDTSFRRELEGWTTDKLKKVIATKSLGEQYLLLEEKIRTAFKATTIFMTTYFNLEDYNFK